MSSYNKKILIDAVYPSEVRVAVLHDGQVVEFDQESQEKKQLKGNIYLAVVSRIEPSLQAVFIEYGPSKHGFLPFSEILLDYYQIPDEEKELLLRSMSESDEVKNEESEAKFSENDGIDCEKSNHSSIISITEENTDSGSNGNGENLEKKEEVKSNDTKNKVPFYKRYKVQDVIKIDQPIMVQIIKEERGNKGATFSTYVTLVGRYCIFMPNSGNKSAISRRIEDAESRKNLREILNSIKLPQDSGVIVRTAGNNKSLKEIEQDLFYLQSLWQSIKNNSISITTPTLIYVEGDIIKRTLRDFYDDKTQEVIVSGNKAYDVAKECVKFMFRNRLRLRSYKGGMPIFTHYKVEGQIRELYTNIVKLPSGGYMVINPTEALVSIDINSGRMTGEDSIEETAYKTNMEAVKEIARQVNLRGLSGLIVIDFIDMLKYRYCRSVESAIKEAFKYDRARIQFGHISAFGLMEISRQRVKQSILETNTTECPHCNGVGRTRSLQSIAASLLRDLRYFANKNRAKYLDVYTNEQVIVYIFNSKREFISELEREFSVVVNVNIDNQLTTTDFNIVIGGNVETNSESEDAVNLFTIDYKTKKNETSVEKIFQKTTSDFWLKKWFAKILSVSN